MSKLGKILLYLAVVGALADIGAAFMSYQKFGTDKKTLTDATQARDTAKADLVVAKKAQTVAEQAEAAANTSLADAKTKLDDLNTKLATDEKTLTDTQTALTTAQAATKTAQDQLTALNTSLGGQSPDDLKTAVKKAQDDLANNQSEVKIMQDQLQATQSQIAELKKDINNSKTGTLPPGISGKVTFVNRAWNFVVLNVGLANGVVPNGELIIYRGRDFLGKVKVTSAESNSCVADILPDAKADIQAGDDVLN
ncbi:MAG: hypothetical protein LV481_02580 [Methylacidiphilales bacterium]|nr:hypothetical protein [Candidatus Methylacidiphilales bacterium]